MGLTHITIKITDANRAKLTKVYEQMEVDLIRELSEVRNMLAALTGDDTYLSSGIDGYSKVWTWIQKARFIIKQKDKALSTTEIANEIINKYEPERKEDRKAVVSAISSIISTNQEPKEGQFVKVQGERQGEYKYSLYELTEQEQELENKAQNIYAAPPPTHDDLPF
jgi:hypothetical protein